MKILVIEDEKKVALALQKGLESEHYDVQVAQTGVLILTARDTLEDKILGLDRAVRAR